jgi:integrase/recombinase XerD
VVVLDGYLEFLAVRSRPNTVAAVAYDLKVFFTVVGKPPRRVVAADVFAFVTSQYAGGPNGSGGSACQSPGIVEDSVMRPGLPGPGP